MDDARHGVAWPSVRRPCPTAVEAVDRPESCGDRVAACMVAVVMMVTQCALPKADRKLDRSIRFRILLDSISSKILFFFLTATKL